MLSILPLLLFSLLLFNCDPLTKKENLNRLEKCGTQVTYKVFKGRETPQSDAPWSVYMLYSESADVATSCTATVVSPRHILTATHCFANINENGWLEQTKELNEKNCYRKDYYLDDPAILNKIQFKSDGKIVAKNPELVVLVQGCDRKTVPDNVQPETIYEDFAVISLSEDMNISPTLNAACVSTDISGNSVGAKLDYYGFGIDPSEKVVEPGTLKHESLEVTDDTKDIDSTKQFHARNSENVNVACKGDSGGGLVAKINRKATIVGVLSQTNCHVFSKSSSGGTPKELYAAVGNYYRDICSLTGICREEDYEEHFQYYVRKSDIKNGQRGNLNIGIGIGIIVVALSLFLSL